MDHNISLQKHFCPGNFYS